MYRKRKKPIDDLREACVEEGLAIIESEGVEKLSMREVARRLGVSHQAPYKHFESRDHVLAEIIARAYDSFADHLEKRSRGPQVDNEMHQMGLAYFEYANKHPLQYRLMFNTPLPDPSQHKDMMKRADRCYSLLRESISKLDYIKLARDPKQLNELDALFVWTVIHGLASALQSDAIKAMNISDETIGASIAHILGRIGDAMSVGSPKNPHC